MAGSSDPESHRNFEAEPGDAAYRRLVDTVSRGVEAWLGGNKGDVIVLAPCGCSRTELLKRLMNELKGPGELLFSKAYAYKGFRRKVGAPQGVDEYASLEELVGELKEWSSGARIAVVPESSCEAVALKQVLETEAPYLRIQLLYLPQLYSKATEGYSEDVKKLAKVKHAKLGEAYKCEAEGCSSTLLRAWSSEGLGKLKEAKEAVLRLSPGTLGLRDYLRDAGDKALAAVFGVPVALAMERALKPVAELGLSGAASALLERVRKIPSQRVEELVSRVLISFAKPEARDKVAEGLARFIESARGAARHLDGGWLEDALETVWDQVALEWSMDARNFKILVRNLAKLTEGELVTKEELRIELEKFKSLIEKQLEDIWEDVLKEREELRQKVRRLEEKYERLSKKLEELEQETRKLEEKWERLRKEWEEMRRELREGGAQLQHDDPLLYLEDVERGGLYENFVVRGGKPMIESREREQVFFVRLVTAGRFEGLAREVLERLGGSGFVVLVGPEGVGKSVLAAYAVWLALRDGFADAVARVSGVERGESLKLKWLAERVDRGRFIAVYDPSPLPAYYKPGAYAREVREAFERSSVGSFLVEETLRELLSLKGVERVSVLVVLPDDVYRSVIERNPELKDELERYTLRADLRDLQFLEEVIKAYSGCTGDFKELAEMIARYKSGYTLVAKYAGLWLRREGCKVENMERALEEAEGVAKRAPAYYLWSTFLKGSGDLARMAAVPLILHAFFGPVPEGVTYLVRGVQEGVAWRLPSPEQLRGVRLGSLVVDELKPLARWLSLMHEDLVEDTLRELCSLKRREPGELAEALEWAWGEILREEEGVPAREALADFVGKRLEQALEAASQSCWRRLALIAGSALTAHYSILFKAAELHLLLSEVLEPCELDSYLLIDSEIPELVVEVAIRKPGVLMHPLARWHREAAKELEHLEGAWRSRGGAYLDEVLYGLGLALAVAGAAELGERVEAWEAGVALYTAALAVQRVLRVECITAILDSFERLGELAPHYYFHLASEVSELTELEKEAAHKIADFLEGALEKHWGELKGRGWPLVEAAITYSNLLTKHRGHFLKKEEERLWGRMCKLLEGLEGQLRDIAEVYALMPALEEGLKPCSGADPAGRAERLLKRLEEMEKEEPSGQAAEWAAVRAFKPGFKLLVKEHKGLLTFTLAIYRMHNDDLEAARELFEKSAEIDRELEEWGSYLICRLLAARCGVLGARNLEELRGRARAFEDLWSEAREHEILKMYLERKSAALAECLVSLALEGRVDEVSELLEREGRLLRLFPDDGVVVRLLLEWLGVSVKRPEAWEVAAALRGHIYAVLRPAFYALMGLPGDALGECDELGGRAREFCRAAVNAVSGDKEAVTDLKLWSLEMLSVGLADLLEREGVQDLEERRAVLRFYRELLDFVERRDARALVQLLVTATSRAKLTLMLWALVNGDEDLARAHAKLGAMSYKSKLPRKLFREAAEARSEEGFKLALMKLFYYHI